MALSPKERERIIEEEQLRYETRQALHREHCAKNRPSRWLWWVAAIVLAALAYCHFACGSGSCAWGGHGMKGKHCAYHGQMADDGVEPGQPLPKK